MRTSLLLGLTVVTSFALMACSGFGGFTQPAGIFPTAGIYTDVKAGGIVLENGATASKEGRACGTGILGIIATGDTTLETAMKNGGVKKVVYVTQDIKWILYGLYAEVCTVARGN
ncbi:MAG: hypothetical protein HY208_04295 [Nitrospirae bacterium]|nr:hypothetical protein [Nitrospirota bacterium]